MPETKYVFDYDGKVKIKKTKVIGYCNKYNIHITVPLSKVHRCFKNNWFCPLFSANSENAFWRSYWKD